MQGLVAGAYHLFASQIFPEVGRIQNTAPSTMKDGANTPAVEAITN
jgi:hypothetical protein